MCFCFGAFRAELPAPLLAGNHWRAILRPSNSLAMAPMGECDSRRYLNTAESFLWPQQRFIKAEIKPKGGCAEAYLHICLHRCRFHTILLRFSDLCVPPSAAVSFLFLLPLNFSLVAIQGCFSGATQRDPSAICNEEDQQAEPDPQKPNPAGVRGARHPHLCRKPICGVHVLLF